MTDSTLEAPGFPRDYSLKGPLNARAVELGLANAQWYHTEIPRARMKELMKRSDGPATRDTILWVGAAGMSAATVQHSKHSGKTTSFTSSPAS